MSVVARILVCALLASALCFSAVSAPRALAQPLRVDRTAERMRVDGALREWKGARFVTLGQGEDAALRYALASVDDGLYVAAEVSDERLIRKGAPGPKQDALVLTLAMPGSAGPVSSELWLHPGQRGVKATAGIAKPGSAPKPEPRVQVVEGPRERGAGYVIEAFVPFALIPGAEIWEQGRAELRFEDVDDASASKPENVLRTSAGVRAGELPKLVLGTGHNDFLGSFASSKGLTGVEPRYDLRGNVAGDGEPERVAILDRYVVVYGKHYKRGETYAYFALPYGAGGGLVSAELLDVTNDGLAELLVRVRQRNNLGARELFVVLSLAEESIAPLFSIELKKESKGGFVESTLSLDKKTRPVRIRVQPGRAQGLDALTYQEDPARDAEPILLPWGDVLYRVYAHDGKRFTTVDEKKQAPEKPSPQLTQAEQLVNSQPTPVFGGKSSTVPESALVDQLRQALGIPEATQPERKLKANLTGSSAEEQVLCYGGKLVVIGPDIGGGAGYVVYGLPVANAQELLYLGAADVTGDGLKELLVRVRQALGGATGVFRELLMVLRVESAGSQAKLSRLLVAEVVRRQDKSAIVNVVRTDGGKLTIEAGQASGFTQASYPFRDEAVAGAERLLLPWSDRPVRYRFDGTRLVAE